MNAAYIQQTIEIRSEKIPFGGIGVVTIVPLGRGGLGAARGFP